MTFLALVRQLAECVLYFLANYLAKFVPSPSLWFERCLSTCPFLCGLPEPPFLLIGVPSGLNLWQSWVLCNLYSRPCFLHRVHCLSLKHTCLDFLGMQELIDSISHLPPAPFGLVTLGGLTSTSPSALFSIFSRINRRALVLTEVLFSVKWYWVCHLDRHMCSKWVVRSASYKGDTCFAAWFVLGL